jgi:periplasmic protein TonB
VVPLAVPVRRLSLFPLFLLASLLLHAAGLVLAARAHRVEPRPPPPSELVVVELERPLPPEPPSVTEQSPRPAPRHVGEAHKHAKQEPPPPNDAPPPEPGPPPPVVVGLTLESTTTANAVTVAPVGNTLVGKPAPKATAPGAVRPGYAPSYQVDTLPVPLNTEEIQTYGEENYPASAKKLGIEGVVQLAVTVEADGSVSAVQVLTGPGHGFNEAARSALLRARFKPATKGGTPVATDIPWKYTFVLNR